MFQKWITVEIYSKVPIVLHRCWPSLIFSDRTFHELKFPRRKIFEKQRVKSRTVSSLQVLLVSAWPEVWRPTAATKQQLVLTSRVSNCCQHSNTAVHFVTWRDSLSTGNNHIHCWSRASLTDSDSAIAETRPLRLLRHGLCDCWDTASVVVETRPLRLLIRQGRETNSRASPIVVWLINCYDLLHWWYS